MIKIIYHWKEKLYRKRQTKIKLLAFIFHFMNINVNVTNTFFLPYNAIFIISKQVGLPF